VDVVQYYPRNQAKTLPDYSLKRIANSIKKRMMPHQTSSYNQQKYIYVEEPNRDELFAQFLSENITLTEECKTLSDLESLNQQYDAFVTGSDQIWAPSIFDPHYFLDFVFDPGKMIAYAPSMGLMTVKDRFVLREMSNLIGRFQHLSLRETQGARIVEQITGKKAEVVADPTLLLDSTCWARKSNTNFQENTEPYLLAYFLGKEEAHIEEASRIAREKGLCFKMIPHFEIDYKREGVIEKAVGPREFISLFKNSSYVCTDSFHGLLFSIQFEKDFSIFERFSQNDPLNQNSRIYNILKLTHTEQRLIPFHGKYQEKGLVDYESVSTIISGLRRKSEQYLVDSLADVQCSKREIPANHILSYHSLCCGCGACSNICHKSAIRIDRDTNGFYRATVDENLCIECGRCRSICQFENSETGSQMAESSIYSYKDNEPEVLLKSSSGGFSFRLATELIRSGYSVLGCTFDVTEQTAKHILIDDVSDVQKIQGSKYIQSKFSDAYKLIS
ncbi:MAG: polysaccharide pyruvyl transferase family protein, partial [Verrucomicrobia bacterium]|nr:polysaccharide pyruvyl transferase family protein [Verrucomicrobiota bacterium]